MAKIDKNQAEEESLIDFPCEFPVKVMGAVSSTFQSSIEEIAKKHDSEFDMTQTTKNISKTGKYISLTLNIHAKDKKQLDRLYQEFTDSKLVLWAL